MKYQLLNGWNPHTAFEAWIIGVNTKQIPAAYFRLTNGEYCFDQPFSPKIWGRIKCFCKNSYNTHEAFARWLVTNTEGDW